MKKKYDNIFQYYGSKNLENNLTKSFQNVLNNIDKKTKIDIINELFKKKLNKNSNIKIILQMGLSDANKNGEKSIIDALILLPKFSIGIEAKLDSEPDSDQLNKEWNNLKRNYKDPELYLLAPKEEIKKFKKNKKINKNIKFISWEDTYNAFEKIKKQYEKNLKNKKENKTYFLLNTYLQNLRRLNMAGRLTEEYFQGIYEDKITNGKKTGEEAELFKELVEKIEKIINNKRGKKGEKSLMIIQENKNYRGWLGLSEYPNEYTEHPHITFDISENEITASANIEGKKIKKWIKIIDNKKFSNKIDEIIEKEDEKNQYELSFTQEYSPIRKEPENILSFTMKLNHFNKNGTKEKFKKITKEKFKTVAEERKARAKEFYGLYKKPNLKENEINFIKNYNRFRVSCFVLANEIFKEESIEKQAQLIVRKSKDIIDIFKIMEKSDKELDSKK